jgi:hypothetical protein
MGKLKLVRFKAETSKGNRLDAGTLKGLGSPDNSLITTRQLPDKSPIIFPDKDVNQPHMEHTPETIFTACPNNCVISKQVSEYTSKPTIHRDEIKRVQSQTTEEWLVDYGE